MKCLEVMNAMEGHLKKKLTTKCGPAPMKHLIHALQPAVQLECRLLQSRLNPGYVAPPLFPLFLRV